MSQDAAPLSSGPLTYSGPNAPPPRVAPTSATSLGGGGAPVLRRLTALVLALLLIAFVAVGAVMRAADQLVGTPQRAASSLLAVVLPSAVSHDLGESVVTQVEKKLPLPEQRILDAERPELVAIFQRVLNEPATQTAIRQAVTELYTDVESAKSGNVDLSALVARFTSALHLRAALISADPKTYGTSYVVHIQARKSGPTGHGFLLWGWIVTILGVGGALLTGRYLVRHRVRQLVYVGLTIGLPALALVGIGAAVQAVPRHLHSSSATALLVATQIFHRIGSALVVQGVILLGVVLGCLVVWMALRTWTTQNRGAPATTS